MADVPRTGPRPTSTTLLFLVPLILALTFIYRQYNLTNSHSHKAALNDINITQLCDQHSTTTSKPTANTPSDPTSLFPIHTKYPAPSHTSVRREPYVSSYVAICSMIKDQNKDIREWIYYHHWLGVDKIYIYDHNSSMPLLLEIHDWIRAGVVEYTMFAGHHNISRPIVYRSTAQDYIYSECLRKSTGRHQWVAFIDIDEYLVLYSQPGHRDIGAFLKNYEAYGGLAINWRLFSSSGHVTTPHLPTVMAYTKCTPPDTIIKSIVNVPNCKNTGRDPHHFEYKKGYFHVNQTMHRCKQGPKCPPPKTQEHIGLHHYATKSREQYEEKMKRRGGAGSKKTWSFYNWVDKWAVETCDWAVDIGRECFKDAASGYDLDWQPQPVEHVEGALTIAGGV